MADHQRMHTSVRNATGDLLDDDQSFQDHQPKSISQPSCVPLNPKATIDQDPSLLEESTEFCSNTTTRDYIFPQNLICHELLFGIYGYGLKVPSSLQSLVLKPIINGNHVIAQSPPGTGKTITSVIGVLSQIDCTADVTQAILLSASPQHCKKQFEIMRFIGNQLQGLFPACFNEENSLEKDRKIALSLPHVCVATPTRALQLIEKGCLRTEQIQTVILDDTDLILTQYCDTVKIISEYLNPDEQYVFLTTKMPCVIDWLANQIMRLPRKVVISAPKIAFAEIKQFYTVAKGDASKFDILVSLLRVLSGQQVLLCVSDNASLANLSQLLQSAGIAASVLTGRETPTDANVFLYLMAPMWKGDSIPNVVVINYGSIQLAETFLFHSGSALFESPVIVAHILDRENACLIPQLEHFYGIHIIPKDHMSEIINDIIAC